MAPELRRAEQHTMDEPLALKLRVLRAERGWTLNQAAARAGVQPETISDAEHGKRRPYTPTLTKIAKGYGVPVEELMGEAVPLAETSQETGGLEEERLETSYPKDRQQWERVLASVRRRQREVIAKVGELVALADHSKADLYQVAWALDEAQDCVNTLKLALPGSRREQEKIILEIDLLTFDVDQFKEWQQELRKAKRFYDDIVKRLVEAGLVELKERTGQKAEPVPVGI
jgi:transcriptional regulator with XRE-family HTH domain